MVPHVLRVHGKDTEKGEAVLKALLKLINLDQELAVTAYLRAREEIIEISTPIVQILDGVVAALVIGSLDSQRTQLLMEKFLESIVDTSSSIAIIDITGVVAIDTATAQHLIDTISAVKLLGSDVIVTGLSPSIAQTLVHLGIDLTGITTRACLSSGITVALEQLDKQIVPKNVDRRASDKKKEEA